MIKQISTEYLKTINACTPAVETFNEKHKNASIPFEDAIQECIDINQPKWAFWLITKHLNHKDNVRFAIYATELVLPIYEQNYPNGQQPRRAITAAKRWVLNPTDENATAAADAADAADAAAAAADAADAAAADAAAAAAAAADAAHAADADIIIKYGLNLLARRR